MNTSIRKLPIGIQAAASATGQAVAGDGFKDINIMAVASDAFLAPGVSAVTGNALDIRPFNKRPFRIDC